MAASPFTERELRFLRALTHGNVCYMMVGLSAAALQGAPVVTQHVDLWFRDLGDPNLVSALQRVGGAYVPPTTHTPPMFAGEGLELLDIVLRMDGLEPFDVEWSRAVEISLEDVVAKVLPLARILISKRAAGRPKDHLVIPVLEDVVALARTRTPSDRT